MPSGFVTADRICGVLSRSATRNTGRLVVFGRFVLFVGFVGFVDLFVGQREVQRDRREEDAHRGDEHQCNVAVS